MSSRIADRKPYESNTAQHGEAERTSHSVHDASLTVRACSPSARLIVQRDPVDPRWEKICALRTELLLRRGASDRGDVVALLSPSAREGRTLLAAQLAIAFAQTGRPTLLVDADLHHPYQHVLFGADNHQGLSQAIQFGTAPPLQAVQGLRRLSLLTAGEISVNSLELLSSGNFASMIDDWRNTFEFVVIDTAPVMDYADGLAVASLAGRVLTLSRAQHTRYKHMQDMLRRLSAARSQILGSVINHF